MTANSKRTKTIWTDEMIATLTNMVEADKGDMEIGKVLGLDWRTIKRKRIRMRIGLADRPAAVPEDFMQYALEKNEFLTERYGVGRGTIARWRVECGVVNHKNQYTGKQKSEKSVKKEERKLTPKPAAARKLVVDTIERLPGDYSLHGLAANHLRKTGLKPVARIEYTDAVGPRGSYLVGKRVMLREEMIEFAKQKGFQYPY